jgi:hypothetical protein
VARKDAAHRGNEILGNLARESVAVGLCQGGESGEISKDEGVRLDLTGIRRRRSG